MIYRMKRYFEEIEPKLVEFKDHNITIVCEKYVEALGLRYFDKEGVINNIYTVNELFEGKLDDMQFDYIVGNPPYQDGKKAGGQNKIYNLIAKQCLDLLNTDGVINFITPVSVTRKSKRFSLLNQNGLKEVNFDTNEDFKEGITICSWIIDKTYVGNVTVISENKSYIQSSNLIYDPAIIDKDFLILYDDIRSYSSNLENRMFQRNNFGPKMYDGNYDLYSRIDGGVTYHSQKEPFFFKQQKFIFRLSGSYNKCFDLTYKDMDLNHVCTLATKDEFENIKTFITSEYFVEQVYKLKKYTSSKSFDLFTYLPKFNKSKPWTNEEVQSFFENREWLK